MKKEQLTELIIKVQGGDSEAANTLFAEIYNDVYFFAYKTVKDSHLAEDITQEALIAIFKSINDLKDPVAFPAWSRQVTYSQCTRYFRKTHDVLLDENEDGTSAFDILEEDNSEFIPHEALDQKDMQKTISSFIDTLSPEQRSAVMLYYFDELPVAKIAEIQGVTEGCVKSRLNYARKAIKGEVEAYEKKTGVRLHALPLLPFIKWIYSPEKATLSVSRVAMESASKAALSAAAANGATASAGSLAAATGAAKAAGIPLIAKIGAGVAAAAVAAGVGVAFSGGENKGPYAADTIAVGNVIQADDTYVDTDDDEYGQPHIKVEPYIEKVIDNVTYVRVNPDKAGFVENYPTLDGNPLDIGKNLGWVAVPGPYGTEPMEDVRSITILNEIDGVKVWFSCFGWSLIFPNLEELVVHCEDIIGRSWFSIDGKSYDEQYFSDSLKRLVVGKEVQNIVGFIDYPNLSEIVIEEDSQLSHPQMFFYGTPFYENEENWTILTDEYGNESRLLICSGILLEAHFDGEEQYVPEGVYAAGNCQSSFYVDSTLHIPSTLVRGLENFLWYPEEDGKLAGRYGGIVISPDNPVYYVDGDCVRYKETGEKVKTEYEIWEEQQNSEEIEEN